MTSPRTTAPRIALIHALEESVLPARAAFRRLWPEADCFDLLDTSLATDLAFAGRLDEAMVDRFVTLGNYAAATVGRGGKAAGILFTCSAFAPAIDTVKRRLPIPVFRPNEAAFAEALERGRRIGLLASFGPSVLSLTEELAGMAAERGRTIDIVPAIASGAIPALKAGDVATHDRIVVEAARSLSDVDVLVLGQFSMARARSAVEAVVGMPVLTTPDSAVAALRAACSQAG